MKCTSKSINYYAGCAKRTLQNPPDKEVNKTLDLCLAALSNLELHLQSIHQRRRKTHAEELQFHFEEDLRNRHDGSSIPFKMAGSVATNMADPGVSNKDGIIAATQYDTRFSSENVMNTLKKSTCKMAIVDMISDKKLEDTNSAKFKIKE